MASGSPKLIKRYANRKLYDTKRSCYVTLDEIAQMVQAGEDVKIVDNKTKEDMTAVTLAQIIFEQEKKVRRMPLNVLRGMIQSSGEVLADFFQRRVTSPVTSLRDEMEKTFDRVFHRGEGS
ncbi:MAG: polyhydroxyalkanoate synthesis regulator DNA-binding domain-containing protein, partial [Deltaproteobacteria bacterium]|nr:polyhydroxyalkanoate synthesis regulator DNA-binding domain-containing protein [Deltaproteobacteria bacterium]